MLLASDPVGPLDILLIAAARRLLGGRLRAEPSSPRDMEPSSGWRGNLLFLAVWAGAIVAVALLVR